MDYILKKIDHFMVGVNFKCTYLTTLITTILMPLVSQGSRIKLGPTKQCNIYTFQILFILERGRARRLRDTQVLGGKSCTSTLVHSSPLYNSFFNSKILPNFQTFWWCLDGSHVGY